MFSGAFDRYLDDEASDLLSSDLEYLIVYAVAFILFTIVIHYFIEHRRVPHIVPLKKDAHVAPKKESVKKEDG